MSLTKDEVRALAEADLATFARLVNPARVYGDLHEDVFHWLQDEQFDQLLLLPRAHMKSHCIAMWVAWKLTKMPWVTVLYVSATELLAVQQLYAIKQIFESPVYRRYWPDMVATEESKREKWSQTEIKLDSPKRKERGVRDPSILAKSIEGNTTGLHCDVLVLDDIVVPDNAYTAQGRQTVNASVSQFSSIANPGAITKAVGTRYHPGDVYGIFKEMVEEVYDDVGNSVAQRPVWAIFERAVQADGVFIWPRQQHAKTLEWYGFNHQTLAKIRSKYMQLGETAQYYAQYFNDPNDPTSNRLDQSKFQYYNREKLKNHSGLWCYNGKPLAIYACADFAYTTGKRSDFTAFAVIGVDADGFIFILDLHQFKSDKYEDYYKAAAVLHQKWGFRKLRVETNAGANLIAGYMRDELRRSGSALIINPQAARGDKVERIAAILEPRYENNTVFHPREGIISIYEEQLLLARPAHDDLKDAVAGAVEDSRPPSARATQGHTTKVVPINSRFGGFKRA